MKIIFLSLAIMTLSLPANAQTIDEVLRSVEQNNVLLQAAKKSGEAQLLDSKSQNNLDDPSIEYSPFFAKGINGVATSELIVKQSFDFPTLYSSRNKATQLQQQVIDLRLMAQRRDILLAAKQLCLDIICLNQEQELLRLRQNNADTLAALYEKRLQHGDATIIEVNKVKLDRMNIATAMMQNSTERTAALQSLTALNANQQLSFDATEYPLTAFDGDYDALYQRAIKSEVLLQQATAEVKASEQDVKVSRQSGLPKFDIGYRRNTEETFNSNGFLVGVSVPLFSNRHKVKTAKAQLEANELQMKDTRMQEESRLRSLISQARQARATADIYDTALLRSSLESLRKAVEGGVMSLTDYYVEADSIYENLLSKLRLENKYQKLMAELLRNDL